VLGTQVTDHEEVITAENISKLKLIANWGEGEIFTSKFAPNGKYLAVVYPSGVRLFDTSDFREHIFIDQSFSPDFYNIPFHRVIDFSPDSLSLAILGENRINIWDVSNGTQLRTIKLSYQPLGIVFDRDIGKLLTRDWNEVIWLDIVSENTVLDSYKYNQRVIVDMAFLPDGRPVIATREYSSRNVAQIWNLDGELLSEIEHPDGNYFSGVFSRDGSKFATVDSKYYLREWNIVNGQAISTNSNQRQSMGNAFFLSFSENGSLMASLHLDGRSCGCLADHLLNI